MLGARLFWAEGGGDLRSLRVSQATALPRGRGGPDRSESTRAGDSRVDGSDAGTLAAITGRSVGRHGAARQSPAHALPGPMIDVRSGCVLKIKMKMEMKY